MFIAQMVSESCSWMALGNTKDEAKIALMERWNKRQRYLSQNGIIDEPWLVSNPKYLEEEYGIEVKELQPGECKMDWED